MSNSHSVHIIALNGSPHRGGNTATLMGWVAEGCIQAGAEVDWIHLVDYDIEHCRGCFTCLRTGTCPVADDVPALIARLVAADGVIVGSPVYAGQPTSRLKALIDRVTLLQLYTRLFERQWSVGAATSGVAPTGGVAKGAADLFGRRCGAVGATTASIKHGYHALTEADRPRAARQARAAGRALVACIQTAALGHRQHVPTLAGLWFGILWRHIVTPLVTRNPEQFAGVLRIWREKGWLEAGTV